MGAGIRQFVPHGKGRVLRVRDLPYEVLLVLLQYMYNCLEEIDEDMLMDMFKASQVYGIAALHQDCLRHLQDMMDSKTGTCIMDTYTCPFSILAGKFPSDFQILPSHF